MINRLFLLFSAAIVSFLLTYPLILALRFFGLTQSVREEGPASHRVKSGTPTMAGIGFVLTIIALALIFINFEFDWKYLALIVLTAVFALIGLTDDLLKIIRKKNLGLTFGQKIIVQTLAAAVFSYFLLMLGHQQTVGGLLRSLGLANATLYFLFSVFVVVGTANATNLTDGLNGLLAGTAGIAFLAFAFVSAGFFALEAETFSAIAAGAVLVFLFFNFPRAQAFMGDVGSLAIGAALAGLALVLHQELRLIIIGGIFVVETLAVIIQVSTYKLWKKRIFKMTPLHHHFELLGFRETQVVVGFWIAGVILGIVGVII